MLVDVQTNGLQFKETNTRYCPLQNLFQKLSANITFFGAPFYFFKYLNNFFPILLVTIKLNGHKELIISFLTIVILNSLNIRYASSYMLSAIKPLVSTKNRLKAHVLPMYSTTIIKNQVRQLKQGSLYT
jgi:hypothetical protein